MGGWIGGGEAKQIPPEERLAVLKRQIMDMDQKKVDPKSIGYVALVREATMLESKLELDRQNKRR